LGWYPVGEDEVIEIKGFNFNGATTSVTVNGTALNGVTVIGGNTRTHISARVDNDGTNNNANTIVSGPLVVTVNSHTSINNRNNNDAVYNQEPNNLNNNTLNDDRNLYVWNTGYLLNTRVTSDTYMRMDSNANRYLSYVTYERSGSNASYTGAGTVNTGYGTATWGRFKVRKNNDEAGPASHGYAAESSANRYLNTTVAADESGNWYAGASNISSIYPNYYTFSFYARGMTTYTGNDGNATRARDGFSGGWNGDANGLMNNNKRRLLEVSNGDVTDAYRVRNPRMMARSTNGTAAPTNNNATRLFMSYYDGNSKDNPVVFRYGLVGVTSNTDATLPARSDAGGNFPPDGYTKATNGSNNGNLGRWGEANETGIPRSYDSGTYDGYTGRNLTDGTGNSNNGKFGSHQVVANNFTEHKGSIYTAVGGLKNGRPVIAWYDSSAQQLCFSYGNGTITGTTVGGAAGTSWVDTTTAQWQANTKVIANSVGTHVDLAVDQDDNVHLAYYDVINGGLYYTYIPYALANGGVWTTDNWPKPIRVDTYLSAGTKLQINVRREGTRNVPYISYFHASFAETMNSVRIAWPVLFEDGIPLDGTLSDDSFTGAWEVMTVPVGSTPVSDSFVCSGVPTAVTGWAVPNNTNTSLQGTGGTTSNLRSYSNNYGGTIGTKNLSNSVMLGYMTNNWYEGAILKHYLY
jgi:hypothetical protein